MKQRAGLKLEVSWQDDREDLLQLDVKAANSSFSASCRVYTSRKDLRQFADQLEGFPLSENAEVIFNAKDPHFGALQLNCICSGAARRVAVIVEVKGAPGDGREETDCANFLIPLEGPAALDSFRESLYVLGSGSKSHAEIVASAF